MLCPAMLTCTVAVGVPLKTFFLDQLVRFPVPYIQYPTLHIAM